MNTQDPRIHAITITGCEGCAEAGEPECTCSPHQFDVKVDCPGVTDDCRAWEECADCNRTDDEDVIESLEQTSEAHGVEHRTLEPGWCARTENCILVVHDEIREIVEGDFPGGGAKPGVYRVRIIPDEFPRLEFIGGAA